MTSPDYTKLDPKFLVWLQQWNNNPLATADYASVSIADRRLASERTHAFNGALAKPVTVRRIDDVIVVARDGFDFTVRIYYPRITNKPQPALLYCHGGGWVAGSISTHDPLCRQLCSKAETIIVSVDYRLAPEHPAPTAVLDCLDAYRYIVDNADALGIDKHRIVVGGDSAGGNIVAAAALELANNQRYLDAGLPAPLLQVLIYPSLDMTCSSGESYRKYGNGYYLRTDGMRYYCDLYLGGGEAGDAASPSSSQSSGARGMPSAPTRVRLDARDPLVSPIFAPSHHLARVCPAYILVAGHDPLRSDGEVYRDVLTKAGHAEVGFDCFESVTHSSVCMMGIAPEVVGRMHDAIAAAIKKAVFKGEAC